MSWVYVLHVIYSEKLSQHVDPRESCQRSVYFVCVLALLSSPPSLALFHSFSLSLSSSSLHLFFSLYYSISNILCFTGPGKLASEIQAWYGRQRGDTRCKFFRNVQNHLLRNLAFVCSMEYFSHDQLKIRVNGNSCGFLDPIDDPGGMKWRHEGVNMDLAYRLI